MNFINNDFLNKYKKYYDINHSDKNIFHNTFSLIISQRIKFSDGQKIRKKIYEIINENEFTQKNISKIKNDDFINICINESKLECIKNILKIKYVSNEKWINDIGNIKFIGIWTIKALKIMYNMDQNVFLSEDFWIRSRLGELIGKKITVSECDKIINKLDKSIIVLEFSKFLWRIKSCGIIKIINDEELNKNDFL